MKMCTPGTKVYKTDADKIRSKDTTLVGRIVSLTTYKKYDPSGGQDMPCYELQYTSNKRKYTALVDVSTREEIDEFGRRIGRKWYSTGTF